MSKITNDGLIQSGTGCFIAVPMAIVGVKGLSSEAATMKRGGVLNEKHTRSCYGFSRKSIPLCNITKCRANLCHWLYITFTRSVAYSLAPNYTKKKSSESLICHLHECDGQTDRLLSIL